MHIVAVFHRPSAELHVDKDKPAAACRDRSFNNGVNQFAIRILICSFPELAIVVRRFIAWTGFPGSEGKWRK